MATEPSVDASTEDAESAAPLRVSQDSEQTSLSWRALYPWPSRYAEIDGVRMHYIDEGSGRPVVLLHGNPTWSFMFRDLIRALVESGFRTIAPDHVGCGLSDKPQQYPYRLDTHIRNLEHLLFERLGLTEVDLVMHDWGGAIGMGLAVRHPERIGRIVLMNTAAFYVRRCPVLIRLARMPGIGETAVRGLNLFVRGALRLAAASPERLAPEVRAGYLAPYDSYAARVAVLGFVRDIPLTPEHPTRAVLNEIERRLPELRSHPVLLCWGMRDFVFTPDFLRRWLGIFPDARTVRFDDAGHYLLEDAGPEVVRCIREFLDDANRNTEQ